VSGHRLAILVTTMGLSACGASPTAPSQVIRPCVVVTHECSSALNTYGGPYPECQTRPVFETGSCRPFDGASTPCGTAICH
jgi:hypothetical protein